MKYFKLYKDQISKKDNRKISEIEPLLSLLSARGGNETLSEMFDNPLYGLMGKSKTRVKDQEQQKDLLTPPDAFPALSKPADGDPDRPPLPTPRNRSFTCSETKPQPPGPITPHPTSLKKPMVPSRSEGGMANSRPPLRFKSRPGPPEPQAPKPRDYKDSSELPSKPWQPARPGQQQP